MDCAYGQFQHKTSQGNIHIMKCSLFQNSAPGDFAVYTVENGYWYHGKVRLQLHASGSCIARSEDGLCINAEAKMYVHVIVNVIIILRMY